MSKKLTDRAKKYESGRPRGHELRVLHLVLVQPKEGVFAGDNVTEGRPSKVARQDEHEAKDVRRNRLLGSASVSTSVSLNLQFEA